MKPGLSLRVSQHLTLTPQLQQSIRLLQLSTLELTQEIEQMLDENPFLERMSDEAPGEEFGLDSADTPAKADDYSADEVLFSAATGSSAETLPDADTPGSAADEPDWGGDGSVEMAPSDAEWGGDARASQRNDAEGDGIEATELAQSEESLAAFLHRQALALRMSEIDRAALYFLIESLNDDGYLEDSLEELASPWPARRTRSKSKNWCTASPSPNAFCKASHRREWARPNLPNARLHHPTPS